MFDSDDGGFNPSENPSFDEIVTRALSRRRFIQMGGAAATATFLATLGDGPNALAQAPERRNPRQLVGFESVPLPATPELGVQVSTGYTANVLYAWGDPVSDGPQWLPDASQGWAEQELQAGMHHDGIAYFPLRGRGRGRGRNEMVGLLCINHEYTDAGLLFPDPTAKDAEVWPPEMAKKVLAAHGVSVIEVRRHRGQWQVVRPSRFGRRITGYTPIKVVGPAAGSPLLQTADDPSGTLVLGTLNNCGGSATPWGTYVTGEENYDFYFQQRPEGDRTLGERRYLQPGLSGAVGVHKGDPRFDMTIDGNRNEANRFGWVVEIDPTDPTSTPRKLTGLGRFKHEMALVRLTRDKRAVAYSGDDERNNYIYKFIGSQSVRRALRQGQSPLEEGTLHVARFDVGDAEGDGLGTGEWIPLTPEHPALAGWTHDEILVYARLAGDAVGATRMDRPEWLSTAPDGQVYVCCTNNSRRGRSTTNTTEGDGELDPFVAAVDEANPRGGSAGNPYGQIVRWREHGDADALTFTWDIFVLAGDPTNPAGLPDGAGAPAGGNINGEPFACPDSITIDGDGRVWVGTDMSSSQAAAGPYANFPNNVLMAADPETREFRRFLIGPNGCEVTGITFSQDQRAMFLDIQHPGEPVTVFTNDLSEVGTHWPDGGDARPRSATLVITKDDGGVIGT